MSREPCIGVDSVALDERWRASNYLGRPASFFSEATADALVWGVAKGLFAVPDFHFPFPLVPPSFLAA